MAGIIAGRDLGVTASDHDDDAKYFAGVAPDARCSTSRWPTADGATDVSQVIAAHRLGRRSTATTRA